MSSIRAKDTKPEKLVRTYLHLAGLRFRLHEGKLPGRPDIVLKKFNAVVFVHGCFWHLHRGCRDAKLPGGSAKKRAFWKEKLIGNRNRDERSICTLLASGMRVAVLWECATRRPALHPRALDQLLRWIKGRRRHIEIPQIPAGI